MPPFNNFYKYKLNRTRKQIAIFCKPCRAKLLGNENISLYLCIKKILKLDYYEQQHFNLAGQL